MRRDDPRHGTSAGYQAHKREGKTPCKPCRDAYAQTMKRWRQQNNTDWKAQQSARTKALTRLAHQHRDDFERFYAEERMKQRGGAA